MTILINHGIIAPDTFAFGLAALGTKQSVVPDVPASYNIYTTVASGTACTLAASGYPTTVRIGNFGANVLTVFPPVGWSFNNGTVNASITVAVQDNQLFIAGDPNESSWWTL